MGIEITGICLECRDNVKIKGSLYQSPREQEKGIIIVCSALGVARSFYDGFAKAFSRKGFDVITFDYRGTGQSEFEGPRENLCLEDWGRQDICALIRYAKDHGASGRVFLVGHSVGGQLFCLADNARDLHGVVLAGASFPHWARWPFPRNLLMFFFWYGMVPVLGLGRKRFPTKMLGLSKEDLPAGLVLTWARWARHPEYVLADKFGLDTRGFSTLDVPILSYGFDDDTYAPEKSVRRLLDAFGRARIRNEFLKAGEISPKGMGHFGYFKESRAAGLWEDTLNWMNSLE